jgi:hypothetical protein
MTNPTMGHRLLHAEVVSPYDGPHVLVRGIAPDTSAAEIEGAAVEAWRDEFDEDDSPPPTRWRHEPCRLYRWVPAMPGDEYARWLRWAGKPGSGAFWAVEVHPVAAGAATEGDADAR